MPAVGSGLSAKKRTSAGEGGFVMVKTDQFNLNQPITMMNAQSITNPFLSIDEDSLYILFVCLVIITRLTHTHPF